MSKKKKKSVLKTLITFLIIAFTGAIFYRLTIYKNQGTYEDGVMNKLSKILPKNEDGIPCQSLKSPYAILIRLKDNKILMDKKSEERIYPASLTKIMTAMVAIENLKGKDEKIKLSSSMFDMLYKRDASMAGFKPEEQVRAMDLLYGILLPSGAECCIGIADKISGGEKEFVRLMNKKAALLGMKNTHFENSTGLQDNNHYTTVKDLSILLKYALKNSTFRKIFTSKSYSTEATNVHPQGITFNSTLFEGLKDRDIDGEGILGGKTGYTEEAGLCLASLAREGNNEYILVTAGAKGNHKSKQFNISDAAEVFNSIRNK